MTVYVKPFESGTILGLKDLQREMVLFPDDDEIWQAQVKRVLFPEKLVKGYFFLKRHNWNENKLWVRESRSSQMDSINFSSILDIATGEWQHSLWKES